MFSLLPDSTASNSRHLSNGIFQASRLELSNFICYLLVCIIEQMGLLVFYFCICVRFKCALNFIAYYIIFNFIFRAILIFWFTMNARGNGNWMECFVSFVISFTCSIECCNSVNSEGDRKESTTAYKWKVNHIL